MATTHFASYSVTDRRRRRIIWSVDGPSTLINGVSGFGAWRINTADHYHDGQVIHKVDEIGVRLEDCRVKIATGYNQLAFTTLGHAHVFSKCQLAIFSLIETRSLPGIQ